MTTATHVTLNNGVEMPLVGFGVFEMPDDDCDAVVRGALDVGYRLIDTAQAYHNEAAVGRALRTTDVPREEIFVTTKVRLTEHETARARASIEASLAKLGTDYLDMVLIHQPLGDYYAAYRVIAEMMAQGQIRAIGVSNFSPGRLMDLSTFGPVVPAPQSS